MTRRDSSPHASRRGLLAAAGGLAAAVGTGFAARSAVSDSMQKPSDATPGVTVEFWGDHQAGIVTPAQEHT
jgi:deferrochelatase/peroxidase EfeB